MTEDRTELTRADLKQVNALAATLNETAEELLNLCRRRHPSLHQAQWLMRQANLKICEIFHNLERITERKPPMPDQPKCTFRGKTPPADR